MSISIEAHDRICQDLHQQIRSLIVENEKLRAALEQPEQEPVAWRFKKLVNQDFETDWVLTKYEPPNGVNVVAIEPLFTHPPRREWRSLSDEEMHGLYRRAGLEAYYPRDGVVQYEYERRLDAYARAIEAALKEKNYE